MMADTDTNHTDRMIQQAIAGDTAAADKLIASYRAYLRKVIDLRMDEELRVRVDPSDVIQETQMVAIQRIDEFLVGGRPTRRTEFASARKSMQPRRFWTEAKCGRLTSPPQVGLLSWN